MNSLVVKSGSLNKLLSNFFIVDFKRNKMLNFRDSAVSDEDGRGHNFIVKAIQSFIPKLTSNLHKGQCGRVGIIGGSFEYTGAPYFAAISSLKMGADLVHVFCCKDAGPVIKSYSPELIVHPFLDSPDVVNKIEPWLKRLHALVIGPGLGTDEDVLKNVSDIITCCKKNQKKCLPLIIDADGFHVITKNISQLEDYKGPIILTPNKVEFARLKDKMSGKDSLKISAALNAVLVEKGPTDIITNGIYNNIFKLKPEDVIIECDIAGSNRRCGGQGDVLSGCTATFVAWLEANQNYSINFGFDELKKKDKEYFLETFMMYSYAVYGACVITRTCSRLAYEANGRGMTASDMILHINRAFVLHFGP